MDEGRQHRPSLSERVKYLFDKSMSAGTVALIGWLAALSLAIILIASAFIVVMGIKPEGENAPHDLVETGWESLMRTIDPGTVGGDEGWSYRLVMLAVTIAGIFIFSALIGVLSSGLEAKIAELRKGRSRVLEKGHTVILNWSPSIVDIATELALADPKRRPSIVVLADRDKVEMEDEFAAKKVRGANVICRSGDPTALEDLAIVNLGSAKSIIVLAPQGEDPDAQVIKTVLAITNAPDRGSRRYQIVAEIREARNAELAKTVGGAEVEVVLADDLISRILVQSTRQSGLSGVFSELLGFDGSEIYTATPSGLAGRTFGDALGMFRKGALIGLCDETSVRLNPAMDTVIREGEGVIVIAESTKAIKVSPNDPGKHDAGAIRDRTPVAPTPKRILMLGWNRKGPAIVKELSRSVLPGSVLTLAADMPGLKDATANLSFPNLAIERHEMDTTRDGTLTALDLLAHNHVVVLGYTDTMSAQSADTRTLVTLLQIRKQLEAAGRHINVVSEMVDPRNRSLAEVTRADDFVVSNQLVSLMLAQASENRHLAAIFAELLDEEGCEVYVRPVSDYVAIDRPVNFHTIIEAARRRNEVAFGYRTAKAGRGDRHLGGVVINPRKDEARQYKLEDTIVVLARE